MKTTSNEAGLECPHCNYLDEDAFEYELTECEELVSCNNCDRDFLASASFTTTWEAATICGYYFRLRPAWDLTERPPKQRCQGEYSPLRRTRKAALVAALRIYAKRKKDFVQPHSGQVIGLTDKQTFALGRITVDDQSPQMLRSEIVG
jgi:hypothetical protein